MERGEREMGGRWDGERAGERRWKEWIANMQTNCVCPGPSGDKELLREVNQFYPRLHLHTAAGLCACILN